jgi:hypothetical protein
MESNITCPECKQKGFKTKLVSISSDVPRTEIGYGKYRFSNPLLVHCQCKNNHNFSLQVKSEDTNYVNGRRNS